MKYQNNIIFTMTYWKQKLFHFTKATTVQRSFMYCQIEKTNFKHYSEDYEFLVFLNLLYSITFVFNR